MTYEISETCPHGEPWMLPNGRMRMCIPCCEERAAKHSEALRKREDIDMADKFALVIADKIEYMKEVVLTVGPPPGVNRTVAESIADEIYTMAYALAAERRKRINGR